MTTKELFSKFESLEANLKRSQYLLEAIRSMSNHQTEITDLHSIALVSGGVNESFHACELTRKKLREIIAEIKKLSAKRIFTEINIIVESLAKTESGFDPHTSEKLNLLKKEFEAFGEAYEKFITAQQLGEAARLLSVAQRVDVATNSSVEFTSIVLKNLCPEALLSSEDQIEIYLSSETDFLLFLEKITALYIRA